MIAEQNETKPFSRVLRPGSVFPWSGAKSSCLLFLRVEYREPQREDKHRELSISGVVGPLRNGNAIGSCGQIELSKLDFKSYAEGWDAATVARLDSVWKAWHLNGMRAGCQHQRAGWDTTEKVEAESYSVDWDTHHKLLRDYREQVRAHGAHKPRQVREDIDALRASRKFSPAGAMLAAIKELGLRPFAWSTLPQDAGRVAKTHRTARRYAEGWDEFFAEQIEAKKRTETKTLGWLREDEHPRGMLSKPCEECGYKYGSAWLSEDVPTEVLEFIQALPEADREPEWV